MVTGGAGGTCLHDDGFPLNERVFSISFWFTGLGYISYLDYKDKI